MKVASEMYLILKSFNHYNCVVIPTNKSINGKLLAIVVKCIHKNKTILITKEDI